NLECPSLHRFFRGPDEHPGLLDLFVELDSLVPASGSDAHSAGAVLDRLQPDRFVVPSGIPSLSLLKAGRFDGGYFSAVSSFGWAALHERAPGIINALLDFWASRYRFVLIDSTSGVNDMSGLCAMMIPDKLVAAFTPNRQSLLGILDVAACAADERNGSGGPLLRAYHNLAQRLLHTAQPWGAFDAGVDLSVIEVDGRMLPLADAQALCMGANDCQSLQTLAVIKERLGKPDEAE